MKHHQSVKPKPDGSQENLLQSLDLAFMQQSWIERLMTLRIVGYYAGRIFELENVTSMTCPMMANLEKPHADRDINFERFKEFLTVSQHPRASPAFMNRSSIYSIMPDPF